MTCLFIMFDCEMKFFFCRTTKGVLHRVAVRYASQSMNTQSRSALSTEFHAKVTLIIVEIIDLFPE